MGDPPVPQPWKWTAVVMPLVIAAAVVVPIVSSPMCGTKLAHVALDDVGRTADAPLSVPPGTSLILGLHASSYSHEESGWLILDAELLRAGQVVASVQCEAFELEGAGGGCEATHYNSDCALKVPPEGADTIRARAHVDHEMSSGFSGLEVEVVKD